MDNICNVIVSLYYDNEEDLHHRKDSRSFSTWENRDQDINMEVQEIMRRSKVTFQFRKLKGHVDDSESFVYDEAQQYVKQNIVP